MVTADDDNNVRGQEAAAAAAAGDHNKGISRRRRRARATYLVRRDVCGEDGCDCDGLAAIKEKSAATSSSSSSVSSEVVLIEDVLSPSEAALYLQMLSTELPWNVEVDNFGQQTRQTCYFGDQHAVFSYVGLRLQPTPWPGSLDKLRRIVEDACGLSPSSSSSSSSSHHVSSMLTACLANHYPTGEGHIPWHYDEVRAHGRQKVVASLSLGGPRRFQLRRRRRRHCPVVVGVGVRTAEHQLLSDDDNDSDDGKIDGTESRDGVVVADILLPSGSVLLMRGDVQSYYEHRLPLSTRRSSDDGSNSSDGVSGGVSGGGDQDQDQDRNNNSVSPHRISLTFRSIVPGYEDRMFQTTAQDSCCT